MASTELADITDPRKAMRKFESVLWKAYTLIETTGAIRPGARKVHTRVCYVNFYEWGCDTACKPYTAVRPMK